MPQRPGDRRLSHAVIVAADAFDMAADCPLLDQLDENLAAIDAGLPDNAAMIAVAGYLSEENVTSVTRSATRPRTQPHQGS